MGMYLYNLFVSGLKHAQHGVNMVSCVPHTSVPPNNAKRINGRESREVGGWTICVTSSCPSSGKMKGSIAGDCGRR